MLLAVGVLLAMITAIVFVLLFLGNLGSTTGATIVPWWPALVLLAATVGVFVARHYLHGHVLTW